MISFLNATYTKGSGVPPGGFDRGMSLGLTLSGPNVPSPIQDCSSSYNGALATVELTKLSLIAQKTVKFLNNKVIYIGLNEPLSHAVYGPSGNPYTVQDIAIWAACAKKALLADMISQAGVTTIPQVVMGMEEVPKALIHSPAYNSSTNDFPDLTQFLNLFYSKDQAYTRSLVFQGTSLNCGPAPLALQCGIQFLEMDTSPTNWLPATKSLVTYLQTNAPVGDWQKFRTGLYLTGPTLPQNSPSPQTQVDPQARDFYLAGAQANAQFYYLSSAIGPGSQTPVPRAPDDIIFANYGSTILNRLQVLPDDTYVATNQPTGIIDDQAIPASDAYFANWFFDGFGAQWSDNLPATPLFRIVKAVNGLNRDNFTYLASQAVDQTGLLRQHYPLGNIYQNAAGAPGLTQMYNLVSGSGAHYLTNNPSTAPAEFSGSPHLTLGFAYPANSCSLGSYTSTLARVSPACAALLPANTTPVLQTASCGNGANLPVYEAVSTSASVYPTTTPDYHYTTDPQDLCSLISPASGAATYSLTRVAFSIPPATFYQPNLNGIDAPLIRSLAMSSSNAIDGTITYKSGSLILDSMGGLIFQPATGYGSASQTIFADQPGSCLNPGASPPSLYCSVQMYNFGQLGEQVPNRTTNVKAGSSGGNCTSTALLPVYTINASPPYISEWSSQGVEIWNSSIGAIPNSCP